MIALIQRVIRAEVRVDSARIAAIGPGILAFIGVERDDVPANAERLLDRILGYRIFADEAGRMNLSLIDVTGGLLLVPQFTLAADTTKGTRASFTRAAPPEAGESLYRLLVDQAGRRHPEAASGMFGADMEVELINAGPVTFWLRG